MPAIKGANKKPVACSRRSEDLPALPGKTDRHRSGKRRGFQACRSSTAITQPVASSSAPNVYSPPPPRCRLAATPDTVPAVKPQQILEQDLARAAELTQRQSSPEKPKKLSIGAEAEARDLSSNSVWARGLMRPEEVGRRYWRIPRGHTPQSR